jgi:hypothetical protein
MHNDRFGNGKTRSKKKKVTHTVLKLDWALYIFPKVVLLVLFPIFLELNAIKLHVASLSIF